MNKKHWFIFFIVGLLLIAGIILRLNSLKTIIFAEDSSRDYMIARHILDYGENPTVGPPSNFGESHSPFYFYFLAILLWIHNDPLILDYVNIGLQILTIVTIYYLLKEMFNVKIAGVMLIFLIFSKFHIDQSNYIYDPWVAQTFFCLSCFLLLHAYTKKKYFYLLLSVFLLSMSTIINPALFIEIPLFSILIFLYIVKKKELFYKGILVVVIYTGTLSIFYSQTFFEYYKKWLITYVTKTNGFFSVSDFLTFFDRNVSLLFDRVFVNHPLFHNSYLSLSLFLILLSFSYWLPLTNNKKTYLYVLILGILTHLTAMSFLKVEKWRYMFPISIFFLASVVAIISFIPTKTIQGVLLKSFSLLVVFAMIVSFSDIKTLAITNTITNSRSLVEEPFVKIVENKIGELKKKYKFKDFYFFSIYSIKRDNYEEGSFEAFLWNRLEINFNEKLVNIDNSYKALPYVYKPIAVNPPYVFLVCQSFKSRLDEEKECIDKFIKRNNSYSVKEKLYSNYSLTVFLLGK